MKTALLTLAVSILLTPLYAQEKMTLEACMKYAIKHSTSVQQQEIALEDARQNYIGAVASAMPSINASTGGTMNYGRRLTRRPIPTPPPQPLITRTVCRDL